MSSKRPHPIATPPALAWPEVSVEATAEAALPTLRQILSAYRRHGTLPGRIARAEAPPREALRTLGSLRALFLDAAAEPPPADPRRR